MPQDLRECYRILELSDTATLDDARQSYRELVKVWHPDRFSHDPKLQIKAQEKLKQINAAYEFIVSVLSDEKRGSAATNSPFNEREDDATVWPNSAGKSRPREAANRGRFVFLAIAAFIAIVWVAQREPRPTGLPPPTGAPDRYAVPKEGVPLTIASPTTERPSRVAEQPKESSQEPGLPIQPAASEEKYFTINSTRQEVLELQGQPFSFSENLFTYRFGSQIFFRDGRVVGWSIRPENVLKARLLPSVPVPAPPEFFTVGSTKDEVLAVQGTPWEFSDAVFEYPDGASVRFRNGRVTSWTAGPKNRLRARLVTPSSTGVREFFTVGSSKDEVIAIQGEPFSFTETFFTYKYGSQVFFENGRVVSWRSSPENLLKAKLEK